MDETDSQGRTKLYSCAVYKYLSFLGRNSRQASRGGRLRTPSLEENVQYLFIEARLIASAQHASSSTDSARHADTSGLLMHDKVAPRVLTAPLQLDSNLLVSLEGALMVPLTCLTCGFPVYPPLASLPSQQKGCSTPWEPPPQHPSTAAPRIRLMINGVMEW